MSFHTSMSRRRLLQGGLGAAGGVIAHSLLGGPASGSFSLLWEETGKETELWRMGLSELALAIREKRLSSREVVQAHLDRIAAVNGALNAITDVLDEEALRAADEVDQALAKGEATGKLHGVPMTVKENIDLAGSATTQGVVPFKSLVAPVDAPQVAHLRRAGAIPIGRTNLPDLALRWHTDSGLWGATRNPWDSSLTPGGSSGGEAAALATGMTPLGLGNDYGGSLRYPAQCCGITSIRPSRGRIPFASSLTPFDPPITIQLFAVQGPMARHVRDLRLALGIMSGPDARDPWWTPAPLEGPAVEKPIRVAVSIDPGKLGVDADVAAGVRKAARALAEAGYAVEEVDPPAVVDAAELWSQLVGAEIRSVMMQLTRQVASADAVKFLDLFLETEPEITLPEYMVGFGRRNGIARQWAQFAEEYPLILGPVSTAPPFPVGRDLAGKEAVREILYSMRLVVAINLLGLPSCAVPVGLAKAVPQGVQIIGPMYREDLCLDAAEAIEQALGVLTPMDPKA